MEPYAQVLYYLALAVVLFILVRLFFTPLRIGLRLLGRAAFGLAGLLLLNVCGSLFSISLAVNPVTVCVAGLLGVPGVALMLLVQGVT